MCTWRFSPVCEKRVTWRVERPASERSISNMKSIATLPLLMVVFVATEIFHLSFRGNCKRSSQCVMCVELVRREDVFIKLKTMKSLSFSWRSFSSFSFRNFVVFSCFTFFPFCYPVYSMRNYLLKIKETHTHRERSWRLLLLFVPKIMQN